MANQRTAIALSHYIDLQTNSTAQAPQESLSGTSNVLESFTKSISTTELDDLWSSVGAEPRGEKWEEILAKSSKVLSLREDGQLVAFSRMVEDGNTCMLYDGVVRESHQGMGLMSRMMNIAIAETKDKGYWYIGLIAAPGTERMYAKMGWQAAQNFMVLQPDSDGEKTAASTAIEQTNDVNELSKTPTVELVAQLGRIAQELSSRQIN